MRPALGRFLSADTVVQVAGNPQFLNRYSYCLNNPLKYVDPTGHLTDDQITNWLGYNIEDLKKNNPELYKLLCAMHIGDVVSTYGQNGEVVGGIFGLEWFANEFESGYRGFIWSADGSKTSVSEWFKGRDAEKVALWRWGPDKQYHQVYTGGQSTGHYLGHSGEKSRMVSKEEAFLDKLLRGIVGIGLGFPCAEYGMTGVLVIVGTAESTLILEEPFIQEDDLIVQYWYPYDLAYRFYEETYVLRQGKVVSHRWRYTDDLLFTEMTRKNFR